LAVIASLYEFAIIASTANERLGRGQSSAAGQIFKRRERSRRRAFDEFRGARIAG
jgi:hypothetical protein